MADGQTDHSGGGKNFEFHEATFVTEKTFATNGDFADR